MATASGQVIETPTAELPFKASITHEGSVILERYFASREEAEAYIAETLKGMVEGSDAPEE